MQNIGYIDEALAIDGDTKKDAWASVTSLTITKYPWYLQGSKQKTEVKLLYSAHALYMLFECEDRHSSARVTELNGHVSGDSCVELFATPLPHKKPHYFNIEINCCGVLLLEYGPHRNERIFITPELAQNITIYHSLEGPVKKTHVLDRGWILEVELPWKVLHAFAGIDAPAKGDIWKMNLCRIGGDVDPQCATWAPIATPQPDFHQPSFFKEVTFL